MGISKDQYREQLQALLPPGMAWTREAAAELTALLDAIAAEFSRIDARADDLTDEADPRTAKEMLTDWERIAGLPDACLGIPDTIKQRREVLTAKLVAQGGQSRAYFIALAESLGYEIQIREFFKFTAGSPAGGALANDVSWRHTWQIDAPSTTIKHFSAGSGAGEPLSTWGNEMLECAIEKRKPAHTIVLFAYYL
jgi:uncharacterized protein YmfQ (DUF2313 family)